MVDYTEEELSCSERGYWIEITDSQVSLCDVACPRAQLSDMIVEI